MPVHPLSPDRLCWRCAPDGFAFATTDDLEDLDDVVGQERAVEALRLALGMERPGYNVYALGPEGIGKHTTVRRLLDTRARERSVPEDWCYVSNFEDPRKPTAIGLPTGRGVALRDDLARLVDDVRAALRAAFENEEYRSRRQVIEEELKERQESAVAEVEEAAKAKSIALIRSPMGFAFAPVSQGKIIPPEVFQAFPEATRKQIEAEVDALQTQLREALENLPKWIQETRERLRQLNDETATLAVGHLIEALAERYADIEAVSTYLEEVRKHIIKNVEAFLKTPETSDESPGPIALGDGSQVFRRFRANLFVDNQDREHAPVVYEDDPTYERLLGRIEHRAEMGTLVTDFMMLQPGALHRANGGYLMVDARKLLTRPMAWDGLKRALLSRELRIESPLQSLGLMSTVTLEPQPIPVDVKVVMVGERMIYYLLCQLDPEFPRLFKIAADFDERVERSDDNSLLHARLIATLARREKLRPFDTGAVARALEFSGRHAADSERLSTDIEGLADLLREADHCAGNEDAPRVAAAHVQQAADAQIYRLDRIRARILEEIERETIAIDTDGTAVGQINGLSVSQIGGFAFGRPTRITARVRLGRGNVVDIEREVELGGPLHSKGVLILSGFLSARYALDVPLSLSATLVFEQSYGGVDGDSASSTELYALLSAVAGLPLRQDLAVTGSVNQHGAVQAIGGVNEKIEGFFDVCAARGLTGEQGVLIPATNVKHLMLHKRVVEAAEAGRFHIYPIETIDEGIELLTGRAAGARDGQGAFPEDTVNRLVEDRLIALAERRRAFGRTDSGDDAR